MIELTDYIKAWEGFKSKSYNDNAANPAKGKWTIGWGFTNIYCKPVTQGMTISALEAQTLLNWLIGKTQGQILGKYGIDQNMFSKNQYDALVAISYNMGVNAIPKLAQSLKIKNFDTAYLNFFDGIYDGGKALPGLIYRRACDAKIFKDNIYECRHYLTSQEFDIFKKVNNKNKDALATLSTNVKIIN